jgi:tyrosyl-tRNA synthetase
MKLSEELVWRGFLNQTTLDDITKLDDEKRTFYMGFDASADSQAVGNLAAMMFIWTFIRHGYDPIILAGGSTSLVGDPKDTEERQMQSEETIAHNVACAQKQLQKIFRDQKFRMVNNLDWTRDVKVLDFLRNIGKNFSMTNLVQRDFIANIAQKIEHLYIACPVKVIDHTKLLVTKNFLELFLGARDVVRYGFLALHLALFGIFGVTNEAG